MSYFFVVVSAVIQLNSITFTHSFFSLLSKIETIPFGNEIGFSFSIPYFFYMWISRQPFKWIHWQWKTQAFIVMLLLSSHILSPFMLLNLIWCTLEAMKITTIHSDRFWCHFFFYFISSAVNENNGLKRCDDPYSHEPAIHSAH